MLLEALNYACMVYTLQVYKNKIALCAWEHVQSEGAVDLLCCKQDGVHDGIWSLVRVFLSLEVV